MDIHFKQWLLTESNRFFAFKDIFGFEKELFPVKKVEDERPFKGLDITRIFDMVEKHQLGVKLPHRIFSTEIRWGSYPECVRVIVSPKNNILFQRYTEDLTGNATWLTKKVFLIPRDSNQNKEETVAEEIREVITYVDQQTQDKPMHEFKDLGALVSRIADSITKVINPTFMPQGIRKINDNNYIIRLNLRGQGVQAPGQKRVEENHTQVSFDATTGLIRVMNYKVQSKLGIHEWKIAPPDADMYFSPAQPKDEIINSIASIMQWY